jgi:hypothetical protein
VRSPEVSSTDDFSERLAMLREYAGDRFAELDVAHAYTDTSVHDLTADVERHREALGRLTEAGVHWIIVPGPQGKHPEALEFVQGFAETYI